MSRTLYFSLLIAITVAIWLPVLIVSGPHDGDYLCYEMYAKALSQGTLMVPYIGYPIYLLIFSFVAGWEYTSLATALLSAIVTVIVISWAIEKRVTIYAANKEALVRIAIVVALTIAGPINMFTAPAGHLFRGYFSETSYANPSYLALRPLALLLFAAIIWWQPVRRWHLLDLFLCLLLSVLLTLTKPNYMLCLVPAAILVFLIPSWRKRLEFRPRAAMVTAIGGIIVLVWQRSLLIQTTYAIRGLGDQPAFIIAPFAGMQSHWLAPKLLFSIAFPLSVLWMLRHELARHTELLFAWLALIIGMGYAYLLAQPGDLLYDGHFITCVQITLFIVFVVSMIELLRRRNVAGVWPKVPLILFSLHVAGGILWYVSRFYPFAGW